MISNSLVRACDASDFDTRTINTFHPVNEIMTGQLISQMLEQILAKHVRDACRGKKRKVTEVDNERVTTTLQQLNSIRF